MTIWFLLIPLILFALGVTWLVRGLRGRRVDDHPICRRCGFDLFGRPEGSSVCSECGADLNHPRAIRDGHRVRRTGMLVVGAVIVTTLLLLAGGKLYVTLSSIDWRTRAPVWYLRREANGAAPTARDAALAELNKRIVAGKLSQEQIDALADDGLKHQGDFTAPWIDGWGDFIDNAWSLNKLSTPRLNKYFDQALASALRLDARPQITRGDRLCYWIRFDKTRVYSRSSNLNAGFSLKAMDLGPLHKATGGLGVSEITLSPSGSSGGHGTSVGFQPSESEQLRGGANSLVMHFQATISKGYNSPPIYTTTLDLKGTVIVHPAGESTVTINRDPSLRPAMEKAIKCSAASYSQPWNPKHLIVTVSVAQLPSGVGYDVYAQIKGKETKVGSFARPARNGPDVSGGFGVGGQVEPFDDATVDLVLKPSVDAAIGTSNTFEIWDGEIVLKNVPVTRPQPPSIMPVAPTSPPASPPASRPRPAGTSTAPG